MLQERRHVLGLTQYEAATSLGINYWTFMTWEKGRVPLPWAYPAIIKFLGYEPWDEPATLGEQLKAERLRRGLSIDAAAKACGADEGTFMRWERDEWNPMQPSRPGITQFLAPQEPLWSQAPRVRYRRC